MGQQPKIGDRVRANALALFIPWSWSSKATIYAGLEGKIIAKTAENNPKLKWGIEFDSPIVSQSEKVSNYYSCFGKGKLGHCVYLEEKYFDIIEEKRCTPSRAFEEISVSISLPFNYSKEDELILLL
jgi:hypothetical protein